MRVGIGYDIHRLIEGRHFVLGGIEIPSETGPDGHSDGDPLLHAVIDAMLGAAALGDIGSHFPPSDTAWKDVASSAMLAAVAAMLDARGWRVHNIDANVIVERPRLAGHIEAIRVSIASLLGLPVDCVSVKAKTNERLGPVGEGQAVAAQAVVLIEPVG